MEVHSQRVERLEIIPPNWFCIYQNRTDKPPCPGAVLYEVRRRESRSSEGIEQTNWYQFGAHHTKVNGDTCYREMGTEYRWFIEIQDFSAFVSQYGPCRFVPGDKTYTTIYLEDNEE